MSLPIETKKKLQAIVDSLIDAHLTNRKNEKYDITACAKKMVDEAYSTGLLVSQGKLPEIPKDEPVKAKKKTAPTK